MSVDLLTIEEAAEYLNVNVSWIRRQVNTRSLPFVKLGHFVRFERHVLDDYVRSSRVDASGR